MASKHEDKWIIKAIVGFSMAAWTIVAIVYICINEASRDNWFLWSLIPAAFFLISLVLLGSAFVHKVKSDLTKRKKSRSNGSSPSTVSLDD
jgi:Kef-type K+ transport system membrane component KefB